MIMNTINVCVVDGQCNINVITPPMQHLLITWLLSLVEFIFMSWAVS